MQDGGNTNFASAFPILDIMFGTFYIPTDRLPADYGADDPTIPSSFAGQLVHPLRQKTLEPAE